MSESYLDRPQDDGTAKAHPAYNRGKIAGVKTALQIIKNVVSGADMGTGVNRSPQVEAVRRAVLEYKTALESSTSKSANEALKKAENIVASVEF